MSLYRFEFFEPRLPPPVNRMGRWHWAKKIMLVNEWKNIVQFWVMKKNAARATPIERARLTLIRHSSARPDFDGLVSSFKVVIDSLRYNGIIADDKHENVGVPEYLWLKAPPRKGGISVVVEEVSP